MKVESAHVHLTPHSNGMRTGGGDEDAFTGRNHPGKLAGVDGHRAGASEQELMPIVAVGSNDMAVSIAC